MNHSLADPNNHAPEVTPGDAWDDAYGFANTETLKPAMLPQRRTLAERAASGPTDSPAMGLRIEPNIARIGSGETISNLEISEIGGGIVRLEQSVPTPEKVPRYVVFHELPPKDLAANSRTAENREWGAANRISIPWAMGIGTGITALVIGVLMLLPMINKSNAARPSSADGDLKVINEEKIGGMEAMNTMLKAQPEALQIFTRYAQATIADDVIPLLLDGEANRDLFCKNWKPLKFPKNWSPPADADWDVIQGPKSVTGVLKISRPDFSEVKAVFIYLNNRLFLDWKASTGYGTATFEELSKATGDSSEIRGVLTPSNFYTIAWPEEIYQNYRLLDSTGAKSIWCYAHRTDKAGDDCDNLFESGEIVGKLESSAEVTVRLRRGEDAALPNQWEIAEILHKGWSTH